MAERNRVLDETVFGFREGKRWLPRNPSYRTLFNWWRLGLKSASGRRVHLETAKVGGERCTSVEAYGRFMERINR